MPITVVVISYAMPLVPLQIQGVWINDGHRIALWDLASRQRISEAKVDLEKLLRPVLSPCCTHIKGYGGAKGLIREVQPLLPQYPFVARFDVAAFYDSIVHAVLLAQLAQAGAPQDLQEPDATGSGIGLCSGGSLSPLLAALYLLPLDLAFQNSDTEGSIFYRRFMDDFVILAKTRRQLRTTVRRVHTELAALGLVVHEKKRFIGRTTTGFDILGYTLHPSEDCALQPRVCAA